MRRKLFATGAVALAVGSLVFAQGGRPASPAGTAAVEVGGKYDPKAAEPRYEGGKWIEITYGRPIRRGREVFGGSGDKYGKVANPDAPVWRAGANFTTQLKTEVPLVINGKTLAPGAYAMLIDLKPNNWTLIVSTQKMQTRYDPKNTTELFGAFNYTPDNDVLRAPMKLETVLHTVEQLTWEFVDVTEAGGSLAIAWDKTMASVPFKIGM